MENALIVILSIIGIFGIYYVLFGRKFYKKHDL